MTDAEREVAEKLGFSVNQYGFIACPRGEEMRTIECVKKLWKLCVEQREQLNKKCLHCADPSDWPDWAKSNDPHGAKL